MKIQVRDLNLKWTCESGSHVLLQGPSGCGKTSFVHLLAGLIPNFSGKIQIGEYQFGEMSAEQLSLGAGAVAILFAQAVILSVLGSIVPILHLSRISIHNELKSG